MSQTPPPGPWGTPPDPEPSAPGSSEPGEPGGAPGFPPPPGYQPPPPPGYQPPQQPGYQAPQQPSGYPPPPGGQVPGGYPPPPPAGGGYQPPGYQAPYGGGLPTPPPLGSWQAQGPGGTKLAGWWYRVGATVIDGLVFLVIGVILAVAIGRTAEDVINLILNAVYSIVLIGMLGHTVGNMAVSTQTIDANTGGIPGYGKAAIRWVVLAVLSITVIGGILDILWPLWDKQNQTIHDKAAGTLVIQR